MFRWMFQPFQEADHLLAPYWDALPAAVRDVTVSVGRIAFTLAVARTLLRLVPRLQRVVTSRVAARASASARPSDSMLASSHRVETLVRVTGSIARAAVYGVASVVLLSAIGIDVTPVVAGAGIAGVAVGFGAQTVVKDFFGGFFILIENQFAVGDIVTIGAITGTVEEMTMRVTVLRDTAGAVHFLPNGGIGTVTNRTHSWQRAVVDITTPWCAPVDATRAALRSAVAPLTERSAELGMRAAPEVEGPLEFTADKVSWRVAAKCDPRRVADVRGALLASLQRSLPRSADGERVEWAALAAPAAPVTAQ